jgi:hypothetical protein
VDSPGPFCISASSSRRSRHSDRPPLTPGRCPASVAPGAELALQGSCPALRRRENDSRSHRCVLGATIPPLPRRGNPIGSRAGPPASGGASRSQGRALLRRHGNASPEPQGRRRPASPPHCRWCSWIAGAAASATLEEDTQCGATWPATTASSLPAGPALPGRSFPGLLQRSRRARGTLQESDPQRRSARSSLSHERPVGLPRPRAPPARCGRGPRVERAEVSSAGRSVPRRTRRAGRRW